MLESASLKGSMKQKKPNWIVRTWRALFPVEMVPVVVYREPPLAIDQRAHLEDLSSGQMTAFKVQLLMDIKSTDKLLKEGPVRSGKVLTADDMHAFAARQMQLQERYRVTTRYYNLQEYAGNRLVDLDKKEPDDMPPLENWDEPEEQYEDTE